MDDGWMDSELTDFWRLLLSLPFCQTFGARPEKCEGLEPAFREGLTAVLFKGPARALVIALHLRLRRLSSITARHQRQGHWQR
jgi:hypothetical protein